MFPLKKGPRAASEASGADREAQLKDEILAELIETLEAGLSRELPTKKAGADDLEADLFGGESDMELEDEDEDFV